MVPWWGWLIISVVGLYVLFAVVMITVAGGTFWALWRKDNPTPRKPNRRRL